jgi:hypothetical protein
MTWAPGRELPSSSVTRPVILPVVPAWATVISPARKKQIKRRGAWWSRIVKTSLDPLEQAFPGSAPLDPRELAEKEITEKESQDQKIKE